MGSERLLLLVTNIIVSDVTHEPLLEKIYKNALQWLFMFMRRIFFAITLTRDVNQRLNKPSDENKKKTGTRTVLPIASITTFRSLTQSDGVQDF